MEVFVLTSEFPMEGEQPIGVFAKREFSQMHAQVLAEGRIGKRDWVWTGTDPWKLEAGSTNYIVRMEPVRGNPLYEDIHV